MLRRNNESLPPSAALRLRLLDAGNTQATKLGSAALVLEKRGAPLLQIDCGPDSLGRFQQVYGDTEPPALFITNSDFDHIGGLESWFERLMTGRRSLTPQLYIPVKLLPILQSRITDYANMLAEAGSNFLDAFQLIPVSESFQLNHMQFDVFPVGNHEHDTAFGIALRGSFLYTSDPGSADTLYQPGRIDLSRLQRRLRTLAQRPGRDTPRLPAGAVKLHDLQPFWFCSRSSGHRS
jgi:phosphoribosyl 1,2-cyclic phosphodiesterase